jgi:hypothetical protein
MFLFTCMAHYGIPSPVVEGGQLMLLYNPASAIATVTKNEDLPNEISVYPNPASREITISLKNNQDEISNIFLINAAGQQVKPDIQKKENNLSVIDGSRLAKGIYFLEMVAGKRIYHAKLMIER